MMTYEILLIVVIGGIGSITGSVLSSFVFVAASEWWLRFLDQQQVWNGWEGAAAAQRVPAWWCSPLLL